MDTRCLPLHCKVHSQCMCTGHLKLPHHTCVSYILEHNWLQTQPSWQNKILTLYISVNHGYVESLCFNTYHFNISTICSIEKVTWCPRTFPSFPVTSPITLYLQQSSPGCHLPAHMLLIFLITSLSLHCVNIPAHLLLSSVRLPILLCAFAFRHQT